MWRVMLKRKDNMAEIICAFISRHDPANATIHQNTPKKKFLEHLRDQKCSRFINKTNFIHRTPASGFTFQPFSEASVGKYFRRSDPGKKFTPGFRKFHTRVRMFNERQISRRLPRPSWYIHIYI